MQQKEVLLIVGVLVVGFFLLNNNGMLSGQAAKTVIAYPNQIGSDVRTDAFNDPDNYDPVQGMAMGGAGGECPTIIIYQRCNSQDGTCTSLTCPCPEKKKECESNCEAAVANTVADKLACDRECARIVGCTGTFSAQLVVPCTQERWEKLPPGTYNGNRGPAHYPNGACMTTYGGLIEKRCECKPSAT